jgi:hypothetical protein
MPHVRYLAETLGPRGSATPQEAQAAKYAFQVMEAAGLQPAKETFISALSAWRPYALASGAALIAEGLFLWGGVAGNIVAIGLMAGVLFSLYREMTFQDNPLRRLLPRGKSQNVWAKIAPAGAVRQRVLLIGHLDSHRTPKVLSSVAWLRIFKQLVPVSLVALVGNALIFILGLFFNWSGWSAASLLLALVIWWVFVLTVEADATPYNAGANDNASGAGVVLSLAARLRTQPLGATEVWALTSGCEEVGCYGAADFIARHRAELAPGGLANQEANAYCVVFDSVGGPGTRPCFLTAETFLTTTRSDPHLLSIANDIAKRRPEFGAYSQAVAGAYTEGRIAAAAGLRVLPLVNLRRDGLLPHWHQPTDVFANIDGLAVQITEMFAWELLHAIDGQTHSAEPARLPDYLEEAEQELQAMLASSEGG